jgi:hypothetical protein
MQDVKSLNERATAILLTTSIKNNQEEIELLNAIKSLLGITAQKQSGWLEPSRHVADKILYSPTDELLFKEPLLVDYINTLRKQTRNAIELELKSKNAKKSELENNPMLWRYVDENGIHSGRVKRMLDYKAKNIVRGILMSKGMTSDEWDWLSVYLDSIEYNLNRVIEYNFMRSA